MRAATYSHIKRRSFKQPYGKNVPREKENPLCGGLSGWLIRPLLLGGTDAAHGGSAVRTLALGDRLAVLRDALNGVLHDLLRLALHAIRLDSHSYLQMSYGASPHFIGGVRRYQRGQ